MLTMAKERNNCDKELVKIHSILLQSATIPQLLSNIIAAIENKKFKF